MAWRQPTPGQVTSRAVRSAASLPRRGRTEAPPRRPAGLLQDVEPLGGRHRRTEERCELLGEVLGDRVVDDAPAPRLVGPRRLALHAALEGRVLAGVDGLGGELLRALGRVDPAVA